MRKWRGEGEGSDYFKYFGQRGAIIRGRRLIEGRLLFEEIRYLILTTDSARRFDFC